MTYLGYQNFVPMHQRRPAYLEAVIDHDQEAVFDFPAPPLGYSFEGDKDDYRLLGPEGHYFQASQLLASKNTLRILDIGAGQGAFVLRAQQLGHTAHALTLHDYRGMRQSMIADTLEPGSYIIGNAERLAETGELLDQYDIIISSRTFWWLADPLGALEQAADRVAVGGRLFVDNMPVGMGLRSDDNRLRGTVGNKEIRAELTRAGFSQTIIKGEGLKDLYAEREQHIGMGAVKAAFAFDYQLYEKGPDWHYKSAAPVAQAIDF